MAHDPAPPTLLSQILRSELPSSILSSQFSWYISAWNCQLNYTTWFDSNPPNLVSNFDGHVLSPHLHRLQFKFSYDGWQYLSLKSIPYRLLLDPISIGWGKCAICYDDYEHFEAVSFQNLDTLPRVKRKFCQYTLRSRSVASANAVLRGLFSIQGAAKTSWAEAWRPNSIYTIRTAVASQF